MRPLKSINPSLRNRFMKKLMRERVVPTISARVGASNHTDSFAATGQDAEHGLDHTFEPFVRRKETKREKDTFALARKEFLIGSVQK